MNSYPKKINLYQFIPNSCQSMSIHVRVFLVYTAQAPHIDIPTPIISRKTNIPTKMKQKNLKNPNFPQF